MLKKQRGFGLGFTGGGIFETIGMPLVILAILAAIAVPAYLDYVKRLRVGEARALAAPARAAVEKAFAAKGPADMSQRAGRRCRGNTGRKTAAERVARRPFDPARM